jgi:Trk K+ transport system NAD-binding subunit
MHIVDTVLFTDHDVLVFATASSAMALLLAVLAVSTGVKRRIERIESKIRQAMWSDVIHQ